MFWNGAFSSIVFDQDPFGFNRFTTTLTATSATTNLGVIFYHESLFWVLDNISLSVVPEPASWAVLIAGFGLTGAMMRRRGTAVAA